jgi:DNA modification methylase
MYHLVNGDCLEALRALRDGCVDAVVTDPPYGLEFMGKEWDSFRTNGQQWSTTKGMTDGKDWKGNARKRQAQAYPRSQLKKCKACGRQEFSGSPCRCEEPSWEEVASFPRQLHAFQEWNERWATAALRVIKPGGILLAFGGTRTWHRLACALEDAGWILRDTLIWLHGQGFPKSKACLKPGWEPILLCRKPGPLWLGVGECRVGTEGTLRSQNEEPEWFGKFNGGQRVNGSPASRWPANLVLSHSPGCRPVGTRRVKGSNPIGPNPGGKPGYSGYAGNGAGHDFTDADGTEEVEHWECDPECPIFLLDTQAGERHSYCSDPAAAEAASGKEFVNKDRAVYELAKANGKAFTRGRMYAYKGGPSRFYATFPPSTERFLYCSKASKKDRGEGNTHPTVKSTTLMSWLVKLACPEGGLVLDPFGGTFSTGVAAVRAGRYFIGVESDPGYFATGRARMEAAR